jgi:hypothetical protein
MKDLCNSFSMNVHKYILKVSTRLSCKMSKFCSEICSIDDDETTGIIPVDEPDVIETPVYEPDVIETPVDEPDVIETPVIIETPVDEPDVIETPVDEPDVIPVVAPEGETSDEIPVDRSNTDDEWDHISSDEDYSHVDEY